LDCHRNGWRVLAAVVGVAGATPCWAALPASAINGVTYTFGTGSGTVTTPIHGAGTYSSAGSGSALAQTNVDVSTGGTADPGLNGHPGVTIGSQMSWAAGGAPTGETAATTSLKFYFTVTGPTGSVPLLYDTAASLTTGPLYRNTAYSAGFTVGVAPAGAIGTSSDVIDFTSSAVSNAINSFDPDPLLGASYLLVSANPNGPTNPSGPWVDCPYAGCSQSIHMGGVAQFQTNLVYEVSIFASTNITLSDPSDSGSASAAVWVDPIFAIDPSNPNAGAYTLTFSPGIVGDQGFPAGAPEPSLWAAMTLGLGAVGARLRRRRSAAGAAASI
jgi:hypothetical protein